MKFDGKKHVTKGFMAYEIQRNIMLAIEAARSEARLPITDFQAYHAHVHTALVLSTMFVDVLNPAYEQIESAVLYEINKREDVEENDDF